MDKGANWVEKIRKKNKKFKNVNLNLFGTNIDGHSVLIQRYLTPMQPPVFFNDKKDKLAAIARFVSLIPFVEDIRLFEDLPNVYCTVQEFLDLGGGDYEEHAILLCNYFNYIDNSESNDGNKCESFLVYGTGMPEGHTVYVMRKFKFPKMSNNLSSEKGNIELWCPITG